MIPFPRMRWTAARSSSSACDSSAAPVFQCTHELHPRLTEMMRAFTRSLVNPRHHISQRRTSVVRRGVEELTPLADVSRTTIGRQISVCRLPDRSAHRSVGSDGDEIYLRTDSPSWITVTSFGPKEWRGGCDAVQIACVVVTKTARQEIAVDEGADGYSKWSVKKGRADTTSRDHRHAPAITVRLLNHTCKFTFFQR